MAPLIQFMCETGWMALAFSILLYVFILLYWISRVLKPAKDRLDELIKNHPNYRKIRLEYEILLLPVAVVYAPVFEELIFRAPLFIWGPDLLLINEWILFLALDAVFVVIHPQYHYIPVRKALKGYENKTKAILKAIRRSVQVGFWGFLCWKTMQWSGSYWGAVLCHSLINLFALVINFVIVPILSDIKKRFRK